MPGILALRAPMVLWKSALNRTSPAAHDLILKVRSAISQTGRVGGGATKIVWPSERKQVLRILRFASVLAIAVPLTALAVPAANAGPPGEPGPAAEESAGRPPGGGTVTRIDNGGVLTRKNTGGKQQFEYHFEVWQLKGVLDAAGKDTELSAAMQVPLSGSASLGEAKGSLKEGVALPFALGVTKGDARLYLKKEKEVWAHIKATTPYGAYDHDVHLFDLEGTAGAAGEKEAAVKEKTASTQIVPSKQDAADS